MRKQNSEFLTAFISEASRKIKNTDFFGFVELDKFACYVIADGIDDDVDAISAKLAVDTVVSSFMESPSMSKRAVRRYLRAANRALLTARSKMKLKASVTVLVTNYVKLRYGQAGNTRFRLYRDGFLRMQSRDSSSLSPGISILILSPSSTSAIGPPTAASGDTCPIDAPLEAPLKRPSVIRATLEPSPIPAMAEVGLSISRMPGPPLGPS